ncbi:hypothetical protein MGMO_11c00760 [Methyloglobulus morosus KoM1]|uniref:DUF4383 domain-containing protein n=1 Tax=Methyloglobulus morosus KoM1 TaxID=1116472 RepID=V5C102_9GAMM|nr:hypothetical protein [Methyloglobulus morosus]ESS73769.1 hypothetical protein MGMO_11c00760 [Methyloglobulus morosus KoM1]
MKIAKIIATFLTALFIGIVLIERIPGVLVDTDAPYEWLMFGLFKIALLDDITHGLSGLAGIVALLSGYRWTVKYLMVIGGYYSLDALFYITNGFFTGQGVIDNFLLNGPHILIAVLVIIALSKSVHHIELTE